MESAGAELTLGLERDRPGNLSARKEGEMIVAIALVLLILALAGGIAVNPLLFLIALLAVVVFLGNGRRGTAL
jgi:hypothetical protein